MCQLRIHGSGDWVGGELGKQGDGVEGEFGCQFARGTSRKSLPR